MPTTKISRSNPAIKALLAATFPDYKGRKIRICVPECRVQFDQNGGGGTYDRVMALRLEDGATARLPRLAPWTDEAVAMANDGVDVPPGMLLVVWSRFCGADLGITIYAAPATAACLAPTADPAHLLAACTHESETTPDGHGARCRFCGETMA